ncbi:MAG: DUF4333 domain-containing protein [Solirubrobacteraceae bacterium]
MLTAVALVAVVVAGCGTTVIESSKATSLLRTTAQGFGASAQSISCPSGVEAKAGKTYTCTATINGQKRTVNLRITNSSGFVEVTNLAALSPAGGNGGAIDQAKVQDFVRARLVASGAKANQIQTVSCPNGLPAQPGKSFNCTATDTSGHRLQVRLVMIDDQGTVRITGLKKGP